MKIMVNKEDIVRITKEYFESKLDIAFDYVQATESDVMILLNTEVETETES